MIAADATLVRLLTWLSPAFPTGAFAYSHGLEWSVEAGDVADEAQARDWIGDLLAHGAGWSDAILLRHACRAPDASSLAALATLAFAAAPSRERLLETRAQGRAFVDAARVWTTLPAADLPYPVAVGALAGAEGVPEDAAVVAFLQAVAASLVSASVRLIPLGQTAGLRVLAGLERVVLAVAHGTRDATLADLGTACFRADVASMRHETQYTRLYRT